MLRTLMNKERLNVNEAPYVPLALGVNHLVQCHLWQPGSHVTGLLWIRHRVAIQSQQLLQGKLTDLQTGS